MREFNIGDKVRVKTMEQLLNSIEPEEARFYCNSKEIERYPSFVFGMEKCCGVEYTVRSYEFKNERGCEYSYSLEDENLEFGDWMLIKA
jgi:hypothetical protein